MSEPRPSSTQIAELIQQENDQEKLVMLVNELIQAIAEEEHTSAARAGSHWKN